MFDDLAAYYYENVVTSFATYREMSKDGLAGHSRDLREALSAANALFHLREHLPSGGLSRGQTESLCFDYALLGDVVNASKHRALTGNTPHGAPLVNDASCLSEEIAIIEYEDNEGVYRYSAKTVVVKLTNGEERNLLEVLTNVINFWEQHLTLIGVLEEPRVFEFIDPIRPRTRSECEENQLNFELTQGQRFRQSMRLLRFNDDTGNAEPIDLSGSKLTFNIYRPKYDIDISLRHDATGREINKTITLSEEDSMELSSLTSEEEKQNFLSGLPQAQEALKELAIQARLEEEKD